MATTAKPPETRMAAGLVWLPAPWTGSLPKETVRRINVTPLKKGAPVVFRGNKGKVDDQYKPRVSFSPAYGDQAGATYSEPLQIDNRTEAAGKDFYWMFEVDQFRIDPLLQGFKLRWDILTPGWTFVDEAGEPAPLGPLAVTSEYTWSEAICNPLYVRRVIKAPNPIAAVPRFRVSIVQKYQP